MSEYDEGWRQCALFMCEILQDKVTKWRDWNGVLANTIADDYEKTIQYIKEKQVENHK